MLLTYRDILLFYLARVAITYAKLLLTTTGKMVNYLVEKERKEDKNHSKSPNRFKTFVKFILRGKGEQCWGVFLNIKVFYAFQEYQIQP